VIQSSKSYKGGVEVRKKQGFISLLLTLVLLLSACTETTKKDPVSTDSSTATASATTTAATTVGDGKMTDVGTPRNQTLIVDILSGKTADPDLVNPYVPGAVPMDAGFHQLIFSSLWEINTEKGEQIPDLAATFPEPLDNTNTKFKFKLQEGLAWSEVGCIYNERGAHRFNPAFCDETRT
jgi:peptide/nickel transport system substrate-binding protein